MHRRRLLRSGIFLLAIGVLIAGLVLFKVRVAVAGGKYALLLVVVIVIVWAISRGMRK